MLQIMSVLWLLFSSSPPLRSENTTDWLTSSHPRITLKFEHAVAPECVVDCTRYLFIVSYRGSMAASIEELREWRSISQAGCIDIVLPGRKFFACKQASSLVGTAKSGEPYALLRYRLPRADADALTASAATLRLGDVSFRLSDAGRTTLADFLQAPVTATVTAEQLRAGAGASASVGPRRE
jgi:hypothetical protein